MSAERRGAAIGNQNDDGMKRYVGEVRGGESLWGDEERCGLIVRPCRYYVVFASSNFFVCPYSGPYLLVD